MRAFTGDDATRRELENFLGEAEMVVYQLEQGIPLETWAAGETAETIELLRQSVGDTVDLDELLEMGQAFYAAENGKPSSAAVRPGKSSCGRIPNGRSNSKPLTQR